jgi:predicted transposase YbfD/YdcC
MTTHAQELERYGSQTKRSLAMYQRAERILPIRTAEDAVVSAIGRELYEKFFRDYTRKQWGLDPSGLDKSVTTRVATRTTLDDRYFLDRFQAIPATGYARMFENMLDHRNIEVQTGVDFADVKARRHITQETGHGREEIRSYIQLPVPEDLHGLELWKGLKSIGVATLVCVRDGKETSETRYYISSLAVSVKLFAHAVRSHWGIENSCHWSLDMTYREDESRIRDPHLRENFAWLNRFTLSLLKQHPGKDSIAMKRRACGWSDEFLAEVLAGVTL